MGAEARLKALGIELPTPPRSMGTYVTAARSGNLLFLSGHGPAAGRPRRVPGQGRPRPHDRAGPGGGAPDGPQPPRHRAGRPRQPRPRAAGRQGARHGAVRRRLHRAPEGDQRLLRPHGRGLRRRRPTRALRRRHGLAPLRDRRRGRDDSRGVGRGGARGERPPPGLDLQRPEARGAVRRGGAARRDPRPPAGPRRGRERRDPLAGIAPTPPTDQYVPAVRSGARLFVAGHDPERDGRLVYRGRVGRVGAGRPTPGRPSASPPRTRWPRRAPPSARCIACAASS